MQRGGDRRHCSSRHRDENAFVLLRAEKAGPPKSLGEDRAQAREGLGAVIAVGEALKKGLRALPILAPGDQQARHGQKQKRKQCGQEAAENANRQNDSDFSAVADRHHRLS